jgi:manganese/iron transport system ATP-binding protein
MKKNGIKPMFTHNRRAHIEARLQQSAAPSTLEVDHITAGYNGKPALENLSFIVEHGGQVAVVGPNGAGKSTLFKTLVGLLPLQAGEIKVHGLPLGDHQYCVAYVPQREEVDWRFPVSVTDVIMMGRFGRQSWLGRPGRADYEAVHRSLELMGIADYARNPIGDLSGGQQQRVFLARAIAQEPHILLMDEPFTSVDAPTQETTLLLLDQLKKLNVTVLVSTHDLNMASRRFDAVLLINRRLIAYGTPQQVFSSENVHKAFGSQILYMDGAALLVDECCPGDPERIQERQP